MSVKHYGIYIAYPPNVDLRGEGLGRHLAMFLKGAETIEGIRFTIVCPSWTQKTLKVLFDSEQVSSDVFDIVAPIGKPYALRLFEFLQASRKRKKSTWLPQALSFVRHKVFSVWQGLTAQIVAVNSFLGMMRFLITSLVVIIFVLVPIFILVLPVIALLILARYLNQALQQFKRFLSRGFIGKFSRISDLIVNPHRENWLLRLFDEMNKHEASRMNEKIVALVAIRAWYCPTAFWPEFNKIDAPRLMCVPDVVLSDFPVGFSQIGGDRYLSIFETIAKSIRGCDNFVTYSENVKWNTLIDRYSVPEASISTIFHAPNGLQQHIEITGFPDVVATSRHYCQTLLMGAMQRSTNGNYTATFKNKSVKYLFYASQLRPNKNVLMLLRSYEFLLRKRKIGHKLILTGHPKDMPDIERFVFEHRLESDVLFLHALSVAELAACYKLADLAVNPSLSEGGCPFTFTEALSVGTPVLMARIAVAEEVLLTPNLQRLTFFDPYDWRDCAKRIEWALNNRGELLSTQLEAYAQLCQRTWADVVREHVQVLDRISDQPQRVTA